MATSPLARPVRDEAAATGDERTGVMARRDGGRVAREEKGLQAMQKKLE
jgi:hypothetical protein